MEFFLIKLFPLWNIGRLSNINFTVVESLEVKTLKTKDFEIIKTKDFECIKYRIYNRKKEYCMHTYLQFCFKLTLIRQTFFKECSIYIMSKSRDIVQ